ncbi:MAG: glutamine--tRNA ligase/YqeY domain fusion protein [Planctomycetota bacterium]
MSEPTPHRDFIRTRVTADLKAGVVDRVVTRFPPEPNGYPHVGHAKAICLAFGLAEEFGGMCRLRFDDTNPAAESQEYVDAIQEDVRWLGFTWEGEPRFASDYFEQLYAWALELVDQGLAYVCDLSLEETRAYRGTVTKPGQNSPQRERSVEENRDLFQRMRAGEFPDGSRTLRAKIDMASPNMNLRDPVLYRILGARHHRTGDTWCIYPMYDWAHGQSDAIECVTHSLCTLEFENHRALYDWFLDHISAPCRPKQIEFNRLNVSYTITSKRKLAALVEHGTVDGWDDPRMPTLRGMRRRGYTPASIRNFVDTIGLSKVDGMIDMHVLEDHLRADLNQSARRAMAVLDPVKLVIENYPEDSEETFEALENPEDEAVGTRAVPFSRELWVERDDFRAEAPRKWHRLAPGKEVRLRYACYVTVTDFETDPETGAVTLLRATWDPESRGGSTPDERKVRGTIHWVSARHAYAAEVRLYDHLFRVPHAGKVAEGEDWTEQLNPDSLQVVTQAKLEPSLAAAEPGVPYQFERLGYFTLDAKESKPGAPVFLRSVTLRDSWAKFEQRLTQEAARKDS